MNIFMVNSAILLITESNTKDRWNNFELLK